MDADYSDNLVFLTNTPAQTKCWLHSQKKAFFRFTPSGSPVGTKAKEEKLKPRMLPTKITVKLRKGKGKKSSKKDH